MDPAKPPASLLTLPTETKERIVQLAWIQDERFRAMRKLGRKSEAEESLLVDSPWYGRSLNALFFVDKEFSAMAAVFLFRVRCVGSAQGRWS